MIPAAERLKEEWLVGFMKNGHRTTRSRLEELDRKQLRALVWAKMDKERMAYDPRYLHKFGTDAGLMLCQLVFWSGKGHDPEGLIYKTKDQLVEEVGLNSRHAVDKARNRLKDEGVLEEEKKPRKSWIRGVYRVAHPSPVLHYRVDLVALAERLGFIDDFTVLPDLEDDDFDLGNVDLDNILF